MNRIFSALCMVLAVLLPACCVFTELRHPVSRPTMAEQIQQKTVALVYWIGVVGRDQEGKQVMGQVDPDQDPAAMLKPYCSGVWVSKDTILTAEHCVDDLGRPAEDPIQHVLRVLSGQSKPAWDPTGQPAMFAMFGDVQDEVGRDVRTVHSATVLAVDLDHDLALVRFDPTSRDDVLPAHPIARVVNDVHVGDEVLVVGHPDGQWWSYTQGWVAQFRPKAVNFDGKKMDVIRVSAPVWFGNSGGGAFNRDGDLVGIASWIRRVPNMAFYIDHGTVRRFLEHNRIRG